MEPSLQTSTSSKSYRLLRSVGFVLLLACLCSNAYEVVNNVHLHRQTDRKAGQLQSMQSQMNDWKSFAEELVVYSSGQPEIDPILQKYGIKPVPVSTKPR